MSCSCNPCSVKDCTSHSLVKCEDCLDDFCRDHMNHKCNDEAGLENREHESDVDEFEDAL